MTPHRLSIFFPLLVLSLVLAACAPSAPAVTIPVIDPSRPLSQQVTVTPMRFEEKVQGPNYTATADIPTIVGVDDPRVKAFNDLTYSIFQLFYGELKNALLEMPVEPITSGSSLDMKYTLVGPPGEIISIKYLVTGYVDGADHPFHNTRTVNFNIDTGQVVMLDALFLPGAAYLPAISGYCSAELASRNIGFDLFTGGAEPLAENYMNWNITADGLLITFDEYQVADYSAGQQTVTVPYIALKDVIDPNGVLGKYIK